MSVLALLFSWFVLSIILGPIAGTVIRNNSTTLDEDDINN